MGGSQGVVYTEDVAVASFVIILIFLVLFFLPLWLIVRKIARKRYEDQELDIVTPSVAQENRPKYSYARKFSIMTNAEQQFHRKIFTMVGREVLIFPQIHLDDLLQHTHCRQNYRAALASIQRKSVDYVLCDVSYRTICAIELDDTTHLKPDRIKRDVFVNSVFEEAGLPIIRVSSLHHRDEELLAAIRRCINGDTDEFVLMV